MHPELPKDEYRPTATTDVATKSNVSQPDPIDHPVQGRNWSKAVLIGGLVLIIGSAIGYGTGFYIHKNSVKLPIQAVQQAQIVPATGTAANIDTSMAQDANSETTIDNQHITSNQTNAQSTDASASNVGGAYDESNF